MFTEKHLCKIIRTLEWLIFKARHLGLYNSCIIYMRCLANLYYTFNIKYTDEELERNIQILSAKLTTTDYKKPCTKKNCVFYDDYSMDNRGLTQQYLEALIKLEYKIIYIYSPSFADNKRIINTLNATGDNRIISLKQNLAGINLAQHIYDIIQNVGTSLLFTQLLPYSVEACIAFCKIDKGIKKHNINLTDHAFNIGTSCIDYNLEFRNFGATTSVKHRGIPSNKEVLLPMYPILDKSFRFEGFPANCKDKVVILTGGAPYKVIDSSELFFKLIKRLLSNPKVVVVYVGCNNKATFERYIIKYDLQDRFVVIENRKDIYEVMRHCDIYMNTYPVGGGLMCQIAASCGKPVLNFKANPQMEECICQGGNIKMSYDTVDDFCQEAFQLINDDQYSIRRGEEFKKEIPSASQFCEMLGGFLNAGHIGIPINYLKAYTHDRTKDLPSALARERDSMVFHKFLLKTLKHRMVLFPSAICELLRYVIKR